MATATINGIRFDNLSVSEMLALANATATQFAPPIIDNGEVEKTVERIVEKRTGKRNSIKATVCGHPITRKGAGRPPRYCEACKATKGADKPQATSETVEKRDWTKEPASKTQVERISRKLDDARVSASMTKRIKAEIKKGVNGGRAREINLALNSVLGIVSHNA